MRLSIEHATVYRYTRPMQFGLQELRLTPKSRAGQTVLRWNIAVEGGAAQARFDDHNNNNVTLIGLEEGAQVVTVLCDGEVETTDTAGVIGVHGGFAPIWFFERQTKLTRPGPQIRKLARAAAGGDLGDVDRLHGLSAAVAEAVAYSPGSTDVAVAAETALKAGAGVCQDHAHIFISAARAMGYPARYVSGYLAMDDRDEQDATHAWAEAHVSGLGWVGFDVSNGMCPDDRYTRVATGLDYKEAAPISGIVFGAEAESLSVSIKVAQ